VNTLEKPIKVKILDNEYLIKSEEEDIEKVYKIAEYINEKVNEINNNSEGLSEKKAVILTALNIAGDYFQALKERDDLIDNIRQRSKALVSNIDSSMG
jgi:cell division protein ZapA (FtsZ GTPase activity inhibitor)